MFGSPGRWMRGAVTKRKFRPSARTVVLDEEGRVLLFRIVDPLDDKPPVWITPGGGIETGETMSQAASRELKEETGLAASLVDLGHPVAVCRGEWEFRGAPLFSEDWFFVLRTTAFEPDATNWTDLERELHRGWRWWTTEDLETTDEVIVPAGLADLARTLHSGEGFPVPVVLPWSNV
jgi:8-oxo-dGTP pyrophosphatase MutT (NUDIX family)